MNHRTPPNKEQLTNEQKLMYASEKMDNFRWISRLVASYSPRTLTAADLVSPDLEDEMAEIGQYAELAYSTIPLDFVFANINVLTQPDFPLEGYDALQGSTLVTEFFGSVARLHVFIAHRPHLNQLILGISGTASLSQALQDLKAVKKSHPSGRGSVHSGFWDLYQGIKDQIVEGLRVRLETNPVEEICITGHSMGGAISYLLMLAVFGSPRPATHKFAEYWQELLQKHRHANGPDSVIEYSIKAYNDGVPSLPLLSLGYRHCTRQPLYFVRGRLYHVPESEHEFALFNVDDDSDATQPFNNHPRGGHNYYNRRDQERTNRRMQWLDKAMGGQDDWEERYKIYIAKKAAKANKN